MTDNYEAIRAKIARLMEMGTDERTNHFEAEAALRQAEKLMRKHAIDAAELHARTGTKPRYVWQTVLVPQDNRYVRNCISWMSSLAVAVANFTDTVARWEMHPTYGKCIELAGEVTDVAYASYLLNHLRDCVRRDAAAYEGTRAQREFFRANMVRQITARMKELKEEQRESLRRSAEHGTSTALTVVDTKIAERNAACGAPSYSTRTSRHAIDGATAAAGEAGKRAGDRVGFGRPVGQDSRPAIGVGG